MKKSLIVALILSLMLIGNVYATPSGMMNSGMMKFEKLDKDNDGKISLEEFKEAHNTTGIETMFKQMDKDGDGYLSPEEFAQMHKKKGKK